VCIGTACDHDSVAAALALGSSVPAALTAGGRAILAYTPTRIGEVLTKQQYLLAGVDHAGADFYEDLSRIRRTGWIAARKLRERHVWTIASPVLNARQEAVAALTVTGSLSDAQVLEAALVTLAAARSASQQVNQLEQIELPL